MAKVQKSRAHKESKGERRGAKKSPQTPVALVLMNKGMAQPKRKVKR